MSVKNRGDTPQCRLYRDGVTMDESLDLRPTPDPFFPDADFPQQPPQALMPNGPSPLLRGLLPPSKQTPVLDADGIRTDIKRPTIDLHAEILPEAPLDRSRYHPGWLMRRFRAISEFFSPGINDQITLDTVKVWAKAPDDKKPNQGGGGVQGFGATTEGPPPLFRDSHQMYMSMAGRPSYADHTRFNSLVDMFAWGARELKSHPDRLRMTRSAPEMVDAINNGRLGLFFGIVGAGPLLPEANDLEAWQAFRKNSKNEIPPGMPLLSDAEVATQGREGTRLRLRWARKMNVQYIGLNHFSSNKLVGSGMALATAPDRGLTSAGRDFIADANAQGIMIDVANASQKVQHDIVRSKCSTLPLISSQAVIFVWPKSKTARMWRIAMYETSRTLAAPSGWLAGLFRWLDGSMGAFQRGLECWGAHGWRRAVAMATWVLTFIPITLCKIVRGITGYVDFRFMLWRIYGENCVGEGWRYTSHEMLAEIKRTGGVAAVNFTKEYLVNDSVADIVDQIDVIKARIGIDYAALGSGANGSRSLAIRNMGEVDAIAVEMKRRGYNKEEIDKVFFRNVVRVRRRVDRQMAESPPAKTGGGQE